MHQFLQDIPHDVAVTVVRHCTPIPALPKLRDARFEFVTAEAAQLYGVASPEMLCGDFISRFRSRAAHKHGQLCSFLRAQGAPCVTEYLTPLTRPDGEEVLTRRKTCQLFSRGGADVWITVLEQISEGDVDEPPDLEAHGFNQDELNTWSGAYTVAEFLEWGHEAPFPHDVADNISYTLADMDVRRKLLAGSVHMDRKGNLQYPITCRGCGHLWYSPQEFPSQCSGCRLSVRKRQRTTRKAGRATKAPR